MKLSKMTILAIVVAILIWGYDELKQYIPYQADTPELNSVPEK